MDLQLRKEFHESLEKLSEKYGLQDIVYASFTLQYGYRNKYCASDIVFSLLAILESSVSIKIILCVGIYFMCKKMLGCNIEFVLLM